MPVTIKVPTALRQFANGSSEQVVQAQTVGQALDQLTSTHHELRSHLYRNGDELRNFINVYLNDEDVRHLQGLHSVVAEGDVITIVPSIAGGA
jgi:MoaD family protein